MFLAINQNLFNSKKRKKEEEEEEKHQQQQKNQQLDLGTHEYKKKNSSLITLEALATPSFVDNMLLVHESESTTTTTTVTRSTNVTRKCKNCHHEFRNNVFEQQQQQQRKQESHERRQHLQPPSPEKQQHLQLPSSPRHQTLVTETDILPTELRLECRCSCDCVKKLPLSNNNSNSNRCSHDPPPSLYAVYLCLGTLAFALATLSILFYSHVSSTVSSSPSSSSSTFSMTMMTTTPASFFSPPSDVEVVPFREQFRRELLASDDMLRSIVAQMLLQQQQREQQQQLQQQNHKRPETRLQQKREVREAKATVDSRVELNAASSESFLDRKPASSGVGYEPLESFRYRSEKLPYDATEVVKNERKFSRSSSINNNISSTSNNKNGGAEYSTKEEEEATQQQQLQQLQRKRRDISSPSSMHADPFIEFFNPNHRKVLEDQDVEIRKRTGLKGAAPGGDEWIYLNTYCRVPEKIITGFCRGTQEYCPASPPGPLGPIGPKGSTGPPGLPGIPGPKGNRGDVGLPGPPGVDGAPGIAGPRGPKGDIGIPGRIGLDGRDGVPGEPGLDGVPGRAGADGIPGKDGLPGRDGRDGSNGKDGKDGAPGPKGALGPPGERGLKGIAGPRGRPGKSGSNGTPGIPGINAWKVQLLNGSFSNDLLVPPSIADFNAPNIQRTVIVEEGKTLNLSCGATGHPVPHIEWRRDDGRTISVHGIEMSSVGGPFLKFSNITRNQMAAYSCFADNGIAPVANATFLLEVHFSPMISVYRQMIYAEYGNSATLECLVEAFPEAIRYWERAYDGKILDPGEKYRIETYPDGFKTIMRLTINNLRKDDFGYYHCVARNELNATMVNFEIAPQDPNSETPYVGKEIKVYGQRPPESECPICENCPDPSLYQCKDDINSNFEIQPTGNYSYPGLPRRQKSCLLYAVGKPVFHKAVNEIYGCWLKDAAAKEIDREKTFVTNENDSYNLFEFPTKMQFRMNSVPRKKYDVREGFHGNAHVVYNGSFYYHQRNTDLVVKLDLTTLKKITTQLPYSGIASGNKLYATDYNYMDFNVDEVGLWVIYSTYDSNNTLVAKLDAENLKMQYNFNITLDHRKFGEMFIVCGHLYAIDSCSDKNSQIRYVVDLYNGKLLNVDLPFSNPFRRTTTVGYNPFTVELYSWDKGNALTYPIRYHEQLLAAAVERL